MLLQQVVEVAAVAVVVDVAEVAVVDDDFLLFEQQLRAVAFVAVAVVAADGSEVAVVVATVVVEAFQQNQLQKRLTPLDFQVNVELEDFHLWIVPLVLWPWQGRPEAVLVHLVQGRPEAVLVHLVLERLEAVLDPLAV